MGNDAAAFNELVGALGGQDGSLKLYPGIDGIPHISRGVRYYKEDDPQHKKPRHAGRVLCEIFDLSDPDEKKRYQNVTTLVYTKAANGKATISFVERKFHEGKWLVLIEWIEFFTTDTHLSRHDFSFADTSRLLRS